MAKSIELEQRLARVELMVQGLRESIATLNSRTTALQAQLDHVAARIQRS